VEVYKTADFVSRNEIIVLEFSASASHICYLMLVEHLNIV